MLRAVQMFEFSFPQKFNSDENSWMGARATWKQGKPPFPVALQCWKAISQMTEVWPLCPFPLKHFYEDFWRRRKKKKSSCNADISPSRNTLKLQRLHRSPSTHHVAPVRSHTWQKLGWNGQQGERCHITTGKSQKEPLPSDTELSPRVQR